MKNDEMRAILMVEKGLKVDDTYLARLSEAGGKDFEILSMLGIIMCSMSAKDFETLKNNKVSMNLIAVKREEVVGTCGI